MNRYLLDTNAYVAFRLGDSRLVRIVSSASMVALNTTILGELFAGFALGSRQEQNVGTLNAFLALSHVRVIECTRKTAETYAQIYASLRRAGKPIPSNDMWIGASAIEHQLQLITLDNHFTHIAGLTVASL
jgi:predicted nucleic acid-binding protein